MAKTDNQRAIFEFLVSHFKSQHPFTKRDLAGQTTWRGKTFSTYSSKQLEQFLVPAGGNTFRVGEGFRPFANWLSFRRHVTQVRRISSDYTLLLHDCVLIFEFFMPLTNETHLRTALDALFYKDTIVTRLKAIEPGKLRANFPAKSEETNEAYLNRLCEWLATRFQGYSISTVSGRFRAQDLLTITDAAKIEQNGDRYLIDETTAIVRFIFPCGTPIRREAGTAADFDDPEPTHPGTGGGEEAKRLRWFFNALFVQSIIQVVNGEAEIWMIESGLWNRLHIWRVEPT